MPGGKKDKSSDESVWKDVGWFALKTAGISGAILGGTALALPAIGFTAGGVAAGSLAAGFQSAFLGGTIASGSAFALLQSAGAAGLAASTQAAVVAASGIAAGAHSIAKKLKKDKKDESTSTGVNIINKEGKRNENIDDENIIKRNDDDDIIEKNDDDPIEENDDEKVKEEITKNDKSSDSLADNTITYFAGNNKGDLRKYVLSCSKNSIEMNNPTGLFYAIHEMDENDDKKVKEEAKKISNLPNINTDLMPNYDVGKQKVSIEKFERNSNKTVSETNNSLRLNPNMHKNEYEDELNILREKWKDVELSKDLTISQQFKKK